MDERIDLQVVIPWGHRAGEMDRDGGGPFISVTHFHLSCPAGRDDGGGGSEPIGNGVADRGLDGLDAVPNMEISTHPPWSRFVATARGPMPWPAGCMKLIAGSLVRCWPGVGWRWLV